MLTWINDLNTDLALLPIDIEQINTLQEEFT